MNPAQRKCNPHWPLLPALIIAWYGLQLLLPDLTDCRAPAIKSVVLAHLHGHCRAVCQGFVQFGDRSEYLLSSIPSRRESNNSYHVFTIPADEGSIRAIVAYPDTERAYRYGFLHRLMTLEFDRYGARTFILYNDHWLCQLEGFSAANPPTAAEILALTADRDKRYCHAWPTNIECSPSPKP